MQWDKQQDDQAGCVLEWGTCISQNCQSQCCKTIMNILEYPIFRLTHLQQDVCPPNLNQIWFSDNFGFTRCSVSMISSFAHFGHTPFDVSVVWVTHWTNGPRNSLCTGRWSSLHSLDHEGRIFLDLERCDGGWHPQVVLLSKWWR